MRSMTRDYLRQGAQGKNAEHEGGIMGAQPLPEPACAICNKPLQTLEVNSLGSNPWHVIAFHSPNALLETGLRMCPPEKGRDSDRLRRRAVSSLRSDLFRDYREIRATFRISE